jgi:hypothetical protein
MISVKTGEILMVEIFQLMIYWEYSDIWEVEKDEIDSWHVEWGRIMTKKYHVLMSEVHSVWYFVEAKDEMLLIKFPVRLY